MAGRQSTIADRIAAAKDTGKEAIFFGNEDANTGTEYEFTPAGIADYLAAEEGFTSGVTQAAAITSLTDNTGSPANNTLENIPAVIAADTDTSAAQLESTNAALLIAEHNIADLAAKVNDILAKLRTAGVIET